MACLDLAHARLEARHDPARHLAEVDAEVLDALAVRHREVRAHADQHLVEGQPGRAESHDRRVLQPGESADLACLAQPGEDVLGPQQRREVTKLLGDRRFDPRIPRPEAGVYLKTADTVVFALISISQLSGRWFAFAQASPQRTCCRDRPGSRRRARRLRRPSGQRRRTARAGPCRFRLDRR